MAVTLGDAIVFLRGDDSGLKKDLAGAEKQTRGWASQLGGTAKKLVGGIVVGAATTATGAMLGIGAGALKSAADVQDATNMFQAQLGVNEDRARELTAVLKNVYAEGYGDSMSDAQGAMVAVQQELGRVGDVSDEVLGRATQDALALRDAYETEVAESTSAAAALVDHFGVSHDEAMDMVAAGLQDTNINNEDYLETLTEYGPQFRAMGFSAEEFYSVLATGSEAGVLGTDKVGDALKEMNIRLAEGGGEVDAAFGAIGLSYEDMAASVAAGESSWADHFDSIVGGLAQIEDPQRRATAQAALFGAAGEDLGVNFTDSLSAMAVGMDELSGSTDSLGTQYNNLGEMWQGFKRRAMMALTPIGGVLLNLGTAIMPLVERGFAWFEATLVPLLERGAVIAQEFLDVFIGGLQDGQGPLEAFRAGLETFLPPETVDKIMGVTTALADFIGKVIAFVQNHSEELKGALIGIGAVLAAAAIASTIVSIAGAIAALANPITAIIAVAGLLGAAWSQNWLGIRDITQTIIQALRLWFEGLRAEFRRLVDFVKAVFNTDWGELGRRIIDGIVQGIKNGIGRIKDAAKNAAQSALDAAKNFLGIRSPSTVMARVIGAPMVEGMARGMEEQQSMLQQRAAATVGAATRTAQEATVTNNNQHVTMYGTQITGVQDAPSLLGELAAMARG